MYSNGVVSNISSLHDALPLSSKFLVQSTLSSSSSGTANHNKLDSATLLAENHALRDAMEQQRFKLKVTKHMYMLLKMHSMFCQWLST